ncbi:hypothetical protein TFLX_04582 [Thermoflexales bacterium]|nr:hypothetical protein TFLX_04582 [Thermoflexales bacterium]
MKPWRITAAVMIAATAVLLMTSIVVAAPAAANGVQINQVYDDPPESILTDTLPITHPVGIVIAVYFNIPYTQVVALHEEGFGFGTIARAYLTAAASDGALTPEQVLALRQEGVGWGEIKQDYGVHPGGLGLGSIMSKKQTGDATATVAPPKKGSGSGGSNCPGNSCNAPGQQKPPKVKPTKAPKK